jgi:uncharacterized protein (DUF342 family)
LAAPRLSIRIAPDKLAAFVSVAAGTERLGLEELRAALRDAGVVAGVDETLVAQLAESLQDPTLEAAEQCIANGRPPRDAEAAHFELAFEQGLAPGTVSDDGHMNFFERGLLKPVEAGQRLATWFAARAPEPGVAVDGDALPARAAPSSRLTLGPGVELAERGEVRARHAGVVLYKPGELLDVVAEHIHRGAVDLRSGHLDMHGSLTVHGDVERLLQARATGDLEVLGSVSGGSLRAGGSLRVSGSVRGGDDGRVVAAQDASVKSCENAEVTAGGTLRVQEAVSSQLYGAEIIVSGRLRGGNAVAEHKLCVKEAGTSSGMLTALHAGEPVVLPDLSEVQRAVMMQKLRRMAERGGVREAFGSRGGGRAKGGKLGRLDAALSADQLRERAEHAERRAALERSAVIELGLAHPGVELCIGRARLQLQQAVRGLRYALDPETGQLRAERMLG